MIATRPTYTTIVTLFLLFSLTTSFAAEDEPEDDYDVKARVVRISFLTGEVTLKRNDAEEWDEARLNSPMVEGDILKTGSNAQAEIQFDSKNFVRLSANSEFQLVTLREEGIALSLSQGTASLRLAQFDSEKESFELDAPGSTIAAEQTGLYRLDVATGNHVRITIRDGGRARIYSANSGFVLRDGRSAQLNYEAEDAEWEFLVASARDSWDEWVERREQQLAQTFRYDSPYYDNQIWGAEDLDNYGTWNYANDYGWIWRPHVTVINNYSNWAPYRHGQWIWLPPYGWTWVGHEPWGWAPYHYGRWVYHNNYWAWCPRSYYHRHRSWWRPALVAFVSVNHSFGPQIYWYPLSYRQRDPYSRRYRRGRWGQVHPAYLRAVTGLRPDEFGRRGARLRFADETAARRIFGNDPLRNLPFRPTYTRRGGDNRRGEARWRRTGAGERTPGVPLNDQLRRSRVWNGREPGNNRPGSGGSGVVNRNRGNRGGGDNSGQSGLNREGLPGKVRMMPEGSSPSPPRVVEERSNPVVRRPIGRPNKAGEAPPTTSNRPGTSTTGSVPTSPRPESRPGRQHKVRTAPPSSETPARTYKPPTPRSEPAPREAKLAPRTAPSVRSNPPASQPPPRSNPRPQRSAPAPRSDPPPQRSAPAPRSNPPAKRSEPVRESRPERPAKDRRSRPELMQDG